MRAHCEHRRTIDGALEKMHAIAAAGTVSASATAEAADASLPHIKHLPFAFIRRPAAAAGWLMQLSAEWHGMKLTFFVVPNSIRDTFWRWRAIYRAHKSR